MLTFGYGSNLCLGRVQWRVPSVQFRGVAELQGYRLVFNKTSRDTSGKANVVAGTVQDKTLGVVFSVANQDEQRLRDWEGGYDSRTVTVYEVAKGKPLEVSVFIARPDRTASDLRPYTWYRRHIVCGGTHWGLNKDYLLEIKATQAREDEDPHRNACELSFPCDRILTSEERTWHDEYPCSP